MGQSTRAVSPSLWSKPVYDLRQSITQTEQASQCRSGMEVSKKDAGSDQGLAPQKLCCAHDVRVLMPTQDHGDPDQIRDGNAVALCLAAAAVPPVCTLHCVLLDMHRTYLPHPSSCHRGASSQSAAGSAKERELDASRMSADGGLGMTATVSRDSTQLHLPWMIVCRNQHHANCQPVDAPAGTRSRVDPADDICRYRSRDISGCQTEERGHWCASSSV